MRNALKCALAGGLLTAGALGPLCGAALAAPALPAPRASSAPPALMLAEAPEHTESGRTAALVCRPRGPASRPAAEIVCVRPGAGGAACPATPGPAAFPTGIRTAGDAVRGTCAESPESPGSPGSAEVFAF